MMTQAMKERKLEMNRIDMARGCLLLMAVASFAAQPNRLGPQYLAVELSLDGAVRDAGAQGRNELLGSRTTTTGETHAILRRGDREIDLHPEGATSSTVIAGDAEAQAGAVSIGSRSHAVVWQGSAESAIDLHTFLPQSYKDSAATGIDDQGNVLGVAIDSDGTAHDMLWRAAKAPSSASATANSGGSGGGGSGGGGGGTPTTDKVSITRALWFGNGAAAPTGELLVQATGSSQDAALTMTDTTSSQFIATLPNIGGGRYGGSVIFRFNPVTSVTVTSSFGGTNTRAVIIGVQ
jgi:hypothetical protein